jgi:hypothetical protein
MSGSEPSTSENHTTSFVAGCMPEIYGDGLFDSLMHCSPLDYTEYRGSNSFASPWWGGRDGGRNGFYFYCHAISQTTDWMYYTAFQNIGYVKVVTRYHFSLSRTPLESYWKIIYTAKKLNLNSRILYFVFEIIRSTLIRFSGDFTVLLESLLYLFTFQHATFFNEGI